MTPSTWHPTTRAALWMGGALLSLVAMALAARHLSATLSVFQILFFRSVLGLMIISLLLNKYGWHQIRTAHLGEHLVRNISHFGGQYGWIYGIAFIPMAQVFAIEFTAPVWSALLAAVILGERLTLPRIVSVVLGLTGVFIIVRPDTGAVHPAALAVLLGSVAFSLSYVMTKKLSPVSTPLSILFYMSLIQLPLGLVPSVMHWVTPTLVQVPLILLAGSMGLITHYCLARAMKLADATVVIPMDFLRLPLIAVVGAAFYGEPLQGLLFVGAACILGGNLYSIVAERRRAADKATQA
ncbi:DMT family transporter [Noviherbaspirillum malthae]|uniref:DMT family transporter n=1 Tax=Noviherbaspirillum malthae TaxID=1260987 RepID=UPI001890901D|nr:DMT family transporter [Noviherbaspirillum malthae]